MTTGRDAVTRLTEWTPEMLTGPWRVRAHAAIGEGFCPQWHGPLAASAGGHLFHLDEEESPWPGGWCGQCQAWWRTAGDHVVTNYPVPGHWTGATAL